MLKVHAGHQCRPPIFLVDTINFCPSVQQSPNYRDTTLLHYQAAAHPER